MAGMISVKPLKLFALHRVNQKSEAYRAIMKRDDSIPAEEYLQLVELILTLLRVEDLA